MCCVEEKCWSWYENKNVGGVVNKGDWGRRGTKGECKRGRSEQLTRYEKELYLSLGLGQLK